MELLNQYVNGNYKVWLYDDGTKVRQVPDEGCKPSFPENIDIKITNQCNLGCSFCHEGSIPNGDHCVFDMDFLWSLKPGTELAIGGGNPFAHPQLREFLYFCKGNGIIANVTMNQAHFDRYDYDESDYSHEALYYLRHGFINGLGISVNGDIEKIDERILHYERSDYLSDEELISIKSRIVLHVINGVHKVDEILKLKDCGYKMLILGYKDLRRGCDYRASHDEEIKKNQEEMNRRLPELIEGFDVVSFDNLALEQLDVKRLLSPEEYEQFYMGDDGTFTMYIDAVKREFASSSTSSKRYDLMGTIEEMFEVVRKEKEVKK